MPALSVGEPLVIWGSAGFLEWRCGRGARLPCLGYRAGDAVLVRVG